VAAQAADAGHEGVGTHVSQAVPDARVRDRLLDVRDRYAVQRLLEEESPDVVVHTAYRHGFWALTAAGAARVALAATACGPTLTTRPHGT
jgi:dTDP-4-dehydrorhamnose reductase